MNKKELEKFAEFFAKEDPEKIIAAMTLVNEIKSKNIEDLEIAIKLSNNPKIKNIIKNVMKMKIDNL